MPRSDQAETRARYKVFEQVITRWKDNDVYGHINNAVYNSWMDTAVTNFFRSQWRELPHTPIIPVAAETLLTFRQSVAHPAKLETGFRVDRIGLSSVKCGVGIFQAGETEAAAWGHMIHVWVDRTTNQSVPIPDVVRQGLETALAGELSA
ncbi:MAG: acyl-CoA thioesterase [Planctomycetes bacterium]|nr:acyl-CoA thioesterase [Planctomycetota bacterium]